MRHTLGHTQTKRQGPHPPQSNIRTDLEHNLSAILYMTEWMKLCVVSKHMCEGVCVGVCVRVCVCVCVCV